MQIYLQFSEREYLRDKVSEVVQIERNAKGKLVFLCISEMQPTFETKSQRYE